VEDIMLSGTKQVSQGALALPGEERSRLVEALLASDQYRRAGWAFVVRAAEERCLENYPCQHSWAFPVERVLKGEGVPAEVRVYGCYTDHGAIPAPLRLAPGDGKLILFVQAGAGADTSVLGAVPWSDEVEALLTGQE
jgi:hypothetical protein